MYIDSYRYWFFVIISNSYTIYLPTYTYRKKNDTQMQSLKPLKREQYKDAKMDAHYEPT